jgi:hypothetical protein
MFLADEGGGHLLTFSIVNLLCTWILVVVAFGSRPRRAGHWIAVLVAP